jgi:hypothetical protein
MLLNNEGVSPFARDSAFWFGGNIKVAFGSVDFQACFRRTFHIAVAMKSRVKPHANLNTPIYSKEPACY